MQSSFCFLAVASIGGVLSSSACSPPPTRGSLGEARVVFDLDSRLALGMGEIPQGITFDSARGTVLAVVEHRGIVELC